MARSRAGGGRRGALAGGGARGAGGGGFGDPVKAVLKFRNRRINTFRGETVDEWGDIDNTGVPYLVGVQAAIAETQDTSFDAATQRQQIIRSVTCRVPAWADIVTTDTIQDPVTGLYYMIESVKAVPSIGYFPAEKELALRERSGVDITSDQPVPGEDG